MTFAQLMHKLNTCAVKKHGAPRLSATLPPSVKPRPKLPPSSASYS